MRYINIDKICKGCNRKCSKNIRDIATCMIHKDNIVFDTKSDLHKIKELIRFNILWFLDDEKCTLATLKINDVNKCIDKILKDLTTQENLSIILKNQDI